MAEQSQPTGNGAPHTGHATGIRAGAIVAVAILAAFLAWLLFLRDDSSTTTAPVTVTTGGAAVSADDLKAFASSNGRTVYWVGPQQDVTYELTNTDTGQVYVRYLPAGATPGTKTPYLTVGTYPMQDAFATTSSAAASSGSVKVPIGDGAVAFYNESSPTSVYVAYPDSSYQVEVYDPSPGRARELVAAGRVTPVAPGGQGQAQDAAKAVTYPELKKLAAELGYPLYWIGTASGKTYEVTQTSSGVYLRYLPGPAEVGSKKAYPTIGSYPVQDAFAVTKEKSQGADAVVVEAPNGGIAFYSKTRPTSVYVAFPDENVQIEVYNPSAAAARRIVTSGRLKPVE